VAAARQRGRQRTADVSAALNQSIIIGMNYISKALDFVLSRAVIFALAFIWCRYYLKSLSTVILASAAITAGASLLLLLFSRPKKRRAALSKTERTQQENAINQLMYSTNRQNTEYFYKLLKNEHNVTLLPECVLSENNGAKALIFARFRFAPALPDDVREIIAECRRYGAAQAVFFGSAFSEKAKDAALKVGSVDIAFMDAAETYAFLKRHGAVPENKVEMRQKGRKPLKAFFKSAFSRTKAKAYLWGAAIMLLCSFFVPYNLYYLISATAFLCFAFLSFLNLGFTRETERNVFF